MKKSTNYHAHRSYEKLKMMSYEGIEFQWLQMASQTQGIQQLLAAEKRAAEKINDARKRKAQRLKQAKQEAQAEIEKYRQVNF